MASNGEAPVFEGIIVRGMFFRGAAIVALAKLMQPGEWIILQRQPDNPYDRNAIQVLASLDCDGEFVRIGFIGREYAAEIAPWMDAGWFFETSIQRVMNGYPIVKLVPMKRPGLEAKTETQAPIKAVIEEVA